jgi:hypothetical protein
MVIVVIRAAADDPDPKLMEFDGMPVVSVWFWPPLTLYSAVPVLKVALRVMELVELSARMSKVPGVAEISWHSVADVAHVAPNAGIAIEVRVLALNAGARVMSKV